MFHWEVFPYLIIHCIILVTIDNDLIQVNFLEGWNLPNCVIKIKIYFYYTLFYLSFLPLITFSASYAVRSNKAPTVTTPPIALITFKINPLHVNW